MNFPVKAVSKRYIIVVIVLVLVSLSVLAKMAYTMTVERDYWEAVADRFVRNNDTVPPTRGNILDCNGEVLAASLPEYEIFMDYMSWEKDSVRARKEQTLRDSLLRDKADSISQGMHAIFPDIDPEAFKDHLLEGREKRSHHWPLYPRKRITYIQYRQCKQLPIFRETAGKGGFHVEEKKTRKNPYGNLARRTIGDLENKDIGKPSTGLERSLDTLLSGKPGIAHRQKVLNRFLTIIDKPAEDGYDVMTTLDVQMQDICEKALGDKLTELEAASGVCILMEVATGDVKAMTSLRRQSDGTYLEVDADAVKNLYEPGSVFKPMSFLVGMDDGYIHMNDVVDVGCGIKEMYGRKMKDANWRSGGSGVVTVPQILQKSLNVGVSTLIDRAYHDNPRKFVEGIYRIGVAEDLHIPIPGYAKPRIRMPLPDGSNWSRTALPWMSIGYETQIPPITTVNFYNGIANNGKMLQPRFVKAILKDGKVVEERPVVVIREQMAKPEAVKNIQDCLESVVSQGLGRKAGSRFFKVAGKTGTAQIWTKDGFAAQYLISFAGYFPADAPKYSCIVCIKKGAPAAGGTMCAPVFKQVAEAVMAQRRVDDYSSARDTAHVLTPVVAAGNIGAAQNVLETLGLKYESPRPADAEGLAWGQSRTTSRGVTLTPEGEGSKKAVPDVRGYGLRDAVYRLERLGLRVKTSGLGKVRTQSLQPGYVFKKGELVTLTLGDGDEIPEAERADTLAAKKDSLKANDTSQQAEQKKDSTNKDKASAEKKKASSEEKKSSAEKKKASSDKKKDDKKPANSTKSEHKSSATEPEKKKSTASATTKKGKADDKAKSAKKGEKH